MALSLHKHLKTSQPSTCIQVQIKRRGSSGDDIEELGNGYQRRANLLWFWKTYQMAHHQCKGQTICSVGQQRRWRDALSTNEPRRIGLVENILPRMKKGDRGSGKKWQMKNMKKLEVILIWWRRAIQALLWKIERKSKMKHTKRGKRNWKNRVTKRTSFHW